jgi:hypothetical protein
MWKISLGMNENSQQVPPERQRVLFSTCNLTASVFRPGTSARTYRFLSSCQKFKAEFYGTSQNFVEFPKHVVRKMQGGSLQGTSDTSIAGPKPRAMLERVKPPNRFCKNMIDSRKCQIRQIDEKSKNKSERQQRTQKEYERLENSQFLNKSIQKYCPYREQASRTPWKFVVTREFEESVRHGGPNVREQSASNGVIGVGWI